MPRPPSMFTVEPGAVIAGRYRLGGVLGRGGMAEVYDGHDLRLERPVAIKLLKPEMAARDDIRSRFEIEARAAAGLSHPNAVAVFDTGEHEDVPFLVMERLPGETLADRIATSSPVDPTWLCDAAEGVLDALALAHGLGIVHRDVKPGNILLTANGTAKIADFGIAKSSGGHADLTATGQLLGTPAYLAPERIEGAPATPRSDLWALGVVLYEALAGQKPFAGRGPIEVARAVAAGDHTPLGDVRPDLDPRLVATIERAMAHDPADRFSGAAAMAASLRGVGVDTTVDDPGDGTLADGTLVMPLEEPRPVAAPRRAQERQRWMAWALIALLVVLILGVLARADTKGTDATGAQTGPSTTAAPKTTATPTTAGAPTPNQSLAQRLRDAAGRLDPSKDGQRAGDLAAGLRRVADDIQSGSTATAAGSAAALVASAAAWNQAGQLTTSALVSALDLLGQVPGLQVTTGDQAPSATSPATAGDSGNSGGKGKGKGKDDNE